MLLEAAVWLGLMRAAIVIAPFRVILSALRLEQVEPTGPPADADDSSRSTNVGWAVRTAAFRTPWNNTCLVQSLAGHVMLTMRGEPGIVVLGVAKGADGAVTAHSWLRSRGAVLTGGGKLAPFSPIAAYARRPGPIA